MDRIRFMLEDLWYYMMDNKSQLVGIIGLIVIVPLAIYFIFFQSDGTVDTTDRNIEEITIQQENAMYYFSILRQSNIGSDQEVMLMVDLYLKRPLQSGEAIQSAANDLMDLYQFNYNRSNMYLKAVSVNIYDRIEQYELGTDPIGTMLFAPERRDAIDIVYADIPFDDTSRNDYTQIRWEAAQMLPIEALDYSIYTTTIDYRHNDDADAPLTNEEFRFLLKLNHYYIITENWDRAIEKYLQWEEGVVPGLVPTSRVVRGYHDFLDRIRDSGGKVNYYERNSQNIKAELLIKNPQWLYYVLEGVYVDNDIEALRGIVLSDRSYLNILTDYTMNSEETEIIKEELMQTMVTMEEKPENVNEDNVDATLDRLRQALDESGTSDDDIPELPSFDDNEETRDDTELDEANDNSDEKMNQEGDVDSE